MSEDFYDWKTADGQKLLYSDMDDSHIGIVFNIRDS